MLSLLYLPGSPDRPPRRQPPPVTGLRRRQWDRLCRCCRSKSITELGYGLDICAFITPIPQHIVLPCILPRLRSLYPMKTLYSLVVDSKFRVRFPPKPSRTDRVVEIGSTDLA